MIKGLCFLGVAMAAAAATSSPTVVVSGATGRVGSALVHSLVDQQGLRVAALVRDAAKARSLLPAEAIILEADYADTEGLQEALASLEVSGYRLFLACGNVPEQAAFETNVLAAAAATGAQYCVKLSTAAAILDAKEGGPYAAHLEVEAALAASGLAYTVLRPNLYTDMLQSGLLGVGDKLLLTDSCSHPFADAPISMIDTRDVAEAAAALLSAADPAASPDCGAILDLTGPDAISVAELADAISSLRSRAVCIKPCSLETHLAAMSLPPPVASSLNAFLTILATRCDAVTDTVERLTGRPPRTASQHVLDTSHAFLPTEPAS